MCCRSSPATKVHPVLGDRVLGARVVWLLALTTAVLAVGGCGDEPPREDPEAVIRGWSRATNAGDYDRAGAFFAPNAVVAQVEDMRLRGPADGARFSASLPCEADVTRVAAEGRTWLATFRLRDGTTRCTGTAEVRFAVRDGKLTEWRQLPPPPPPSGLRTSAPPRRSA